MVTQVSKPSAAAPNRTLGRQSLRAMARNWICGALALLLIVTGRVRRARKKAQSGDVITAIYFHHPNRRLFSRCVQWLRKHGYTFLSEEDVWEMLRRGAPFPKGGVWLSFDDGCQDLLENVLPLVNQYKLPVTLYIPSGIVDGNGLFPWVEGGEASRTKSTRDAMTLNELHAVAGHSEVTIGSHTVTHAHMARCSGEELMRELGESKQSLESWVGYSIKSFSFPYGEFDGREREYLVHCGYKAAVTTENAFIGPEAEMYRIPRFAVANDISFPEAICNMVGVWRPVLDGIKRRIKG